MRALLIIFLSFSFMLAGCGSDNKAIYIQQNVENKIYSVAEINDILNKNPEVLKGKVIKLKAFILESDRVNTLDPNITRYANFDYLIDWDEKLIKEYKDKGYKEQRQMLKNICAIKTGEPKEPMFSKVYPSSYGIYIGHFFENSISDIDGGNMRFVITDKQEEINIPK